MANKEFQEALRKTESVVIAVTVPMMLISLGLLFTAILR